MRTSHPLSSSLPQPQSLPRVFWVITALLTLAVVFTGRLAHAQTQRPELGETFKMVERPSRTEGTAETGGVTERGSDTGGVDREPPAFDDRFGARGSSASWGACMLWLTVLGCLVPLLRQGVSTLEA